jgi:hypothetical protein
MDFLRKNNVLFIWIPKNAGSSVFKFFEPHGMRKYKNRRQTVPKFSGDGAVTFGHISIQSLINRKIVSKDWVNQAFSFAVTRNPYSRLVSLYHFKRNRKKRFKNYTFHDFCELLLSKQITPLGYYNKKGLSQANPQYHWLFDIDGNPLYDFLGRVETLQKDMDKLCKVFNIEKGPVPRVNNTVHKHHSTYYTDALRREIYTYYKTDFELFGYERKFK